MASPITHPTDIAAAHLQAVGTFLRDCLCTNLRDAGIPVCACAAMPGDQVVADWCSSTSVIDGTEAEGMAWVRLVQLFNSTRFPQQTTDPDQLCPGGHPVAEFELGVMRCQHSTADTPVDPGKISADALRQWRDAAILRYVAECCLPKPFKRLPTAYTPLSGGGCMGGRLTVYVQLKPGTPIQDTGVS